MIVTCLLLGFEWTRTNDVGGRESLELFFSLESVSSSMRASKVIEYTCLNMYIRFTTGLINISFSNNYIKPRARPFMRLEATLVSANLPASGND